MNARMKLGLTLVAIVVCFAVVWFVGQAFGSSSNQDTTSTSEQNEQNEQPSPSPSEGEVSEEEGEQSGLDDDGEPQGDHTPGEDIPDRGTDPPMEDARDYNQEAEDDWSATLEDFANLLHYEEDRDQDEWEDAVCELTADQLCDRLGTTNVLNLEENEYQGEYEVLEDTALDTVVVVARFSRDDIVFELSNNHYYQRWVVDDYRYE